MVYLQLRGGGVQLNKAVSKRIEQLLEMYDLTQYELFMRSGVPRSTIGNVINCTYESVKLRVIYEICQGFGIGLDEFFSSPLFDENNLEP
nr:helix-turn-helix domain-containing protein [Anaerotruncus colihominis]